MGKRRSRIDLFTVVVGLVFTISCSGGGCGGCTSFEPIPGGFPPAKRAPNAAQVRVTQSGLAAITADPAAILGSIGGGSGGVLQFNAPASCGGSTPICCPGGNALTTCGPIDIDLNMHAGDTPRMELHPASNASRLDVVVRARVKTEMDIPVTIPVIGDCGVKIDTAAGSAPDIQINAPIGFPQDATAGTTKVSVGTVTINNLTSDDVALTGGFGCQFANLGTSFFLDTLTSQITGAIQSAIQDQTCKACPSGDVAECGSTFATACTGGVCQEGTTGCLQELGLDGRAGASALFGSFSPGTTGALDLYEVAGGYAKTDNNGLALGLLGGMLPGGTDRDRCGPPGTAPAPVTIPQSAFFQGNTRPDTGATFDVGIGLHKSQLDAFAYAGYDGGLLCLTIGHGTVAQLSSSTLSVLSRSLGNLVEGDAPMAVGLRPQSPPVIALGKNTFDGDGNLTEALLDITFTKMEIDFFISVDNQWIRTFTVVSDVHLPIGLQVTAMGQLAPVIGDTANAFTNLSVKNSAAVTETPADLAALFPSVLGLVLPQLSGGLSPISLPSLGGLVLNVTDVTSIENNTFLAIFANLATADMARGTPVDTRVALGSIEDADPAVRKHAAQWKGARVPSVTLDLGGDASDLEWSWQIDDGTWSGWTKNARPRIASTDFWLAGTHHLDVRARRIGHPETIDATPVRVEVPFGAATGAMKRAPFHGTGSGAGCACDSGGSAAGAAPFAILFLFLVMPRRRRRRSLGTAVWLAVVACLPGCSCDSKSSAPCGDVACMDGAVANGGLGRFTSVAADSARVLVATYDTGLGDLVIVDATDTANPVMTVVDGVPIDVTPTYDPSTYRGGIADPGPNVGAHTSIAIANGKAHVAYQDRDSSSLKYAHEAETGWVAYTLDAGEGEEVGAFTSIAVDGSGHPAIAYLAVGNDDGMGHRVTELRLARASSSSPGQSDWHTSVVATAPGTCAGLCGAGEACVAGTDAEACITPTTDCTTACGTGTVCNAGACVDEIAESTVADLPTGTGLFPSLVALADGRLAVAYYNRGARALEIAVESGAGTSMFAETQLDGGGAKDVGMWASAAASADGTVHVAYQDALGDQLFYTTWNTTVGTPEVVDNGVRPDDRTHPVGAASSLILPGGVPTIAYQDGLAADVYVAAKSGAAWSQTGVATGPLLDGFAIGAAVWKDAPILAWGAIDPTATPLHSLVVEAP